MSGTLYVVATPIGNLEDITLRALRVLREVDLIAAEDTRRTAKLLNHHAIETPTISFHEHNVKRRMPELLDRLTSGHSIAVVSDAGTPIMSDPGLELIQACVAREIDVEPLPGANAHLTALTGSGFATQPATLLGFAPHKSSDRKRWLAALAEIPHTVVFFETPHRIRATLSDAAEILGTRPLVVGRELTKIHHEFMRGMPHELAERLKVARGEFTIVLGPSPEPRAEVGSSPTPDSIATEFWHLTDIGGLSRREAISRLSRRHHLPSREVYAMVEAAKGRLP